MKVTAIRHREIGGFIHQAIDLAISSGLSFAEASAAFMAAGEVMKGVDADPSAPDDQFEELARAVVIRELSSSHGNA